MISTEFWTTNLVCPICKKKLEEKDDDLFCKRCSEIYNIINSVPCFIEDELSEHQKSELQFYLRNLRQLTSTKDYFNQVEAKYKWALKWINENTVNRDTKIICIGGSYRDDLPYVKSDFKFNVDHLSHKYKELFPEIKNANVKYLASKSEQLPFPNDYADMIYSRNSLDHVNNPIKTLLEIHRVLKPTGKFFLSVYYNSFFINSHETTIIDKEFVNNHIGNIFDIEWMKISASENEGIAYLPRFSLPRLKKIKWFYAVLKKKEFFPSYDMNELVNYEKFTSNFHKALYYEEQNNLEKAKEYYKKVSKSEPYLQTDKDRILYSKIRYLALSDKKQYIAFFNDFKLKNRDPFWWKIVINNSLPFMKKELERAIKVQLSQKMGDYLIRYIKIKKYKWLNIQGINRNILDNLARILPKSIFLIYTKSRDKIIKK